jgi:cell division protein FtsB
MKTTDTTKRRMAQPRSPRRQPMARVSRPRTRLIPRWIPVVASLTLVLMITATINFRAYSVLSKEQNENIELEQKAQQLQTENLGIQEEIYYLKNDNETIEREAKKYGLVRPDTKVSRAGKADKAEKSADRPPPTKQ